MNCPQPDWIEGYVVGVQVDTERGVVCSSADPVENCRRCSRLCRVWSCVK
jgi:hypothetical protein